ncbi:MAG: hypothetical protein HYU28_01030 [Actinobacteria bacterium]|nr:hypothetical protein [Actinomycetota bacterium]
MRHLRWSVLLVAALIGAACSSGDGDGARSSSDSSAAKQGADSGGGEAPTPLGPVTFTDEQEATSLTPPAPLWLFVIDDGGEQPVASIEDGNQVIAGRLDLDTGEMDRKVVVDSSDLGGKRLADHWHVFAHDRHWIVAAGEGTASVLVWLDRDLDRVGSVEIDHGGDPTNDMFLVAEPDGVAVGLFTPGGEGGGGSAPPPPGRGGGGNRIYRFDTEGRPRGTVDIGSTNGAEFGHSNGSSAIPTDDGFLVLASETLAAHEEGTLKLIETDPDWTPRRVIILAEDAGVNYAMGSGVLLEDGRLVVNARRVETASVPPPGPPGSPLQDDSGGLVRLVVDTDRSVVAEEVLAVDGVNRPHTVLLGDLLITSWDGGGGAQYRIDRISA